MTSPQDPLTRLGITMQEADFSGYDEAIGGCVQAQVKDGFAGIQVVVRPGMEPGLKHKFSEWAESRINRLLDHGPSPDGWQQTSDGVWQLCARREELPSLDD